MARFVVASSSSLSIYLRDLCKYIKRSTREICSLRAGGLSCAGGDINRGAPTHLASCHSSPPAAHADGHEAAGRRAAGGHSHLRLGSSRRRPLGVATGRAKNDEQRTRADRDPRARRSVAKKEFVPRSTFSLSDPRTPVGLDADTMAAPPGGADAAPPTRPP